jgi:hypothetical protein
MPAVLFSVSRWVIVFVEKLLVVKCWIINLSSLGINNFQKLPSHMVLTALPKKSLCASFCCFPDLVAVTKKRFTKFFRTGIKHCWQQVTHCCCIIACRTVRIHNFVCHVLELLFFLLCVMFATDCISFGSCARGCPIKVEFLK